MTKAKLDHAQVASLRAFLELADEDLARLASLRPLAEKCADQIIEDFYKFLVGHRETRKLLPDDATVQRLKATQRQYFLGLFDGKCDLAYVQDRMRVGGAHERVGLSMAWYLGAYGKYQQLLGDYLLVELKNAAQTREALRSLRKLVFLDISLACDTYLAATLETSGRHQAALRELSTPVISVQDRILLLPLVGALDTQRASQVIDSVLSKIVATHAKCIIVDIAGVPVVDTHVAASLVKTTAAARLLGADTILTGVTAQVARTIVRLGVDVSTMHTLATLAEGLELALSLTGKVVRSKGAPRSD